MSTFSRLFGGHAPFEALQEHMKVVLECVVELEPLFDALVVSDEAEMKAVAKRIFVAESKADDLRDALRLHLPRSLFMPIDRRDLLDLLRVQDEMGNITEDVAGSLLRRDMTPPEAMFDDVVALAHEVVEVVRIAAELVALFDELVEVGFRGRMAERVEGIISRLDARETAADKLERELISQLFTLEAEMSPVSVMLWYELLQRVGNVADYAEKVGDRMLLIIAR